MEKKTFSPAIKFITAVIIAITILLSGCNKAESEGFAIYLTKGDIPPDRMEILSHIEIADEPVISIQDIVTYDARTHEIELTDAAFARFSELEIPVEGKSFLVCVDKQPVYWGAFWTLISSISFDGVTIWQQLGSQEPVIKLELGYPAPSFYSGEDPRNNAEVIESLDNAGKLINRFSINEIEQLPHSMKGYELYSWQADNQWHFTLITGTNRTKTLEEIVSENSYIPETGPVKIHVVGATALEEILKKIPQGEFVIWCDELHIGQITDDDIDFRLPPEQITDEIKEYAGQCGLDFTIAVD